MKTTILLAAVAGALALGQAPTPVPGANQGVALTGTVPAAVKEMVSVQAVMLPYTINRELFSKHIAENYAVVVINVGNRSHDAALVMQGLYLDYSKWALSGNLARPGEFDNLKNYSSGTLPGQVSSVEYRIVRGELEERDPKTIRNWILRSLQLAGSVAGGTTFVYSAMSDIPKFISMVNGVGIPGFEKLWPDSLISKLNRISDFGYRVNRIVPRESSDIMIAFFPIERFLTPLLKKIYIAKPALFFNTGLALVDPDPDMSKLLTRVSGESMDSLAGHIPDMLRCLASKHQDQSSCNASAGLRALVAATSLNSIEVVVDGTMVLDLSAVPGVIDTPTFQVGADPTSFWTIPGADKGIVVTGRFLDGATVLIEPKEAGIEWVAADAANSNSEKLTGKLKFTKPVPNGPLTIKIVKESKDGRTVTSLPTPYTVKYSPGTPDGTAVDPKVSADHKLTLTGKNLANPVLSIMLTETKPKATPGSLLTGATINSDGTATFDLKDKPIGCYDATLFSPTAVPLNKQVVNAPSPTVTKATRTGDTVNIGGSELMTLKADCTLAAVTVKVVDDKNAEFKTADVKLDETGKTATFTFAAPVPDAKAKMQVTVTAGSVTSKAVSIDATP